MKRSLFACAVALTSLGSAQTPPVKPTTPDIPVFKGFAFPPLPGVQEEIGKRPLTVEEAVAIALQRLPALRIEFDRMSAAKGRAEQARAGLVPQLGLTYGASNQDVLKGAQISSGGGSGTGLRSNGAVTVTQLLFDFGRTRSLARQQSALAQAAIETYSQAQLDAAQGVRQAFYSLQRSTQLEAVSESNLETRNSQLALASARLESGLGAPADLLRAKNSVGEATIALTNARGATVAARIGLALSLGVDPRTPITLAQSEEGMTEGDVNALVARALEQRPEIRQANANIRASQHGLDAAHQTSLPTINFTANVSARGGNDPLTNQNSSVGINFSWAIGDGGLAQGRAHEARASLDESKETLRQLLYRIAGEVVQATIDMQAAEQRLQTSRAEVENAKELVRISEGRYKGGIGTFLEVTDAQDAYFSALRNVATAQADVQLALASLRRAVGEPVPTQPKE